MDRTILIINTRDSETENELKGEELHELFKNGWVLDPTFKSSIIRLDTAAIYHLCYMDSTEEAEFLNEQKGVFDDVEAVKSVTPDEVSDLVTEGWKLMMVKRKGE